MHPLTWIVVGSPGLLRAAAGRHRECRGGAGGRGGAAASHRVQAAVAVKAGAIDQDSLKARGSGEAAVLAMVVHAACFRCSWQGRGATQLMLTIRDTQRAHTMPPCESGLCRPPAPPRPAPYLRVADPVPGAAVVCDLGVVKGPVRTHPPVPGSMTSAGENQLRPA